MSRSSCGQATVRPHLNADLSTDGRRPRVVHREPVAEGFSVETGVLSSTQNVQVNFRPRGWYRRDEWFGRNRDSALGMWSLAVPEMIGTSEGFVFGFEVPDRWQPAGGGGDAVEYTAESRPLGPDFDRACFAGPDHLIDRDGLVRYRAEIVVGFDLIEVSLHITNLSAAATTFFSHFCCRFHGRGLVWGWRDRALVNVEGDWIPADRLLRGDGYPPARHWFLQGNHPGRAFMEMFRRGSPDDPRTQVITAPWIAMPMQDTRYTTIYGSPQAGMLFVNPDNPCLHSDAVSRSVAPGATAVQRTCLAAFELPLDEALVELDSRIAHRTA